MDVGNKQVEEQLEDRDDDPIERLAEAGRRLMALGQRLMAKYGKCPNQYQVREEN